MSAEEFDHMQVGEGVVILSADGVPLECEDDASNWKEYKPSWRIPWSRMIPVV